MKNILILLFIIMIILFSSGMLNAETAEYSLAEIIELAEKKNTSLESAELAKDKAGLELKKLKSQNELNQHHSKKIEAEINSLTTEQEYKQQHSQIIREIISSYLNLLALEKNQQAQEKTTATEASRYQEMEHRYELEEISYSDFIEQQNDLRDAEIELEELKDKYQHDLVDFKNNLKLENDFELKNIDAPDYWEISRDEALNQAFENSYLLKIKELEIELAEKENEIDQLEAAEIDKQIADISLKEAELALEDEKEGLEKDVISAHLNLEQATERIDLQQKRVETAENDLDRVKKEAELGSTTQNDIQQSEAAFLTQQAQYIEMISNYYTAAEELASLLNLEAGVSIDE
ncbi:MAG: TolC family protein [Halanaerobium sp.]